MPGSFCIAEQLSWRHRRLVLSADQVTISTCVLMNMRRRYLNFLFGVLLLCAGRLANAQHYQAIHGSSQAGSLAVPNNPAAALHVPFAWDLTPIAVQVKHASNAVVVKNYSLLSSIKGARIEANTGALKRFIYANQDIRLLNGRIRLDARQAIAFGLNLRSYISATSTVTNWQDTLKSLREFMGINNSNRPFSGDARGNSWAELFGTYARNLIDDGNHLLNAGITIKVNRSLGAAYINARGLDYQPATINNSPGFALQSGELQYGYSMNIDDAEGPGPFSQQRKRFMQRTYSTFGASLGIEYIVPISLEGKEGNDYNYDWKLGVSILDIGANKFIYSLNSRAFVMNKGNIADTLLENNFQDLRSIMDLNDSIAAIAGISNGLGGYFRVTQPTRIVINADKHLVSDFFINGELTIPIKKIVAPKGLVAEEMSLLALTPRFETKTLGLYLPFTMNTRKQFWIGGAFKAGPLLMGVHNWANLFSKNKSRNGGVYLALTFRPGKKHNTSSRLDGTRLSKEQRRQLECPRL